MKPDKLRALAHALEPMAAAPCFDGIDIAAAADYLRAQADAQPVAWLRPENRVEEECTARTRISIGKMCPPIGTWQPLYTRHAPAAPQAEPTGAQDLITHGISVTLDGKRVDPKSIYRDEPAGDWPESLMLRDTKLHDDMGGQGQRIFTTAGAGYEKRKYIRADLTQAGPKREPLTLTQIGTLSTQGMFSLMDPLDVAEAVRLVERAHGIGGSDAE